MRTSSFFASGTGTSSSQSPGSALLFTTAFMVFCIKIGYPQITHIHADLGVPANPPNGANRRDFFDRGLRGCTRIGEAEEPMPANRHAELVEHRREATP